MAKKEKGKSTNSQQPKTSGNKNINAPERSPSPVSYIPYLIILLFSIALYANTLGNQQAIDDPIVFTSNKFVLEGFGGIKDIMTHDASYGFFGDKAGDFLSGARYRPLSLVSFAIETQLCGTDLTVAHGINVLLFALTCGVLFHVLRYILPERKDVPFYLTIPFITTMLFAGHPIHTEAVANIKGRDEILALLFSLLSLSGALKYVRGKNLKHLGWAGGALLLALLSKENAISFIVIIPLTYFFFTGAKVTDYVRTAVALLVPVILFFAMRAAFTKAGGGGAPTEVLNNPFLYLPGGMDGFLQKYATIVMTFLLYYKVLLWPHPLTHDYFFNQIPTVGVANPLFIISLLANGALLVYAALNLRRKSVASYAILFYFVTFAIYSNVFFTVGILMTERFLFMCSVGFCLLMAYLLTAAKEKFKLPAPALPGILVVILSLYAVKTISRNRAWYDNTTLFLTDAKTSTRSAKVQMAIGDDLTLYAAANMDSLRKTGRLQYVADLLGLDEDIAKTADTTIRRQLLEQGEAYIKRSLEIYPERSAAWLVLGTTAYKLHRPQREVISYYAKADSTKPGGDYESLFNIGCVYIDMKMWGPARENFRKSVAINPGQLATCFNLAICCTNLNQPDSALIWFGKCLEISPREPAIYNNMIAIYKEQDNADGLIQSLNKAIEINPGEVAYYDDLSAAYSQEHMPDDVIRVSELCLVRSPDHLPALRNLATAYRQKGNVPKAQEYTARVQRLTTGG